MGAGTRPFNRPGVFTMVIEFVDSDGRTSKPLDPAGDVYRQLFDGNGLPDLLRDKIHVEARWEEPRRDADGRILGQRLLILGTIPNGGIDPTKAEQINCNVDEYLRNARFRQVNSKQSPKATRREATGAAGVVTDNIDAQGNHHGPCRDCCPDRHVIIWE